MPTTAQVSIDATKNETNQGEDGLSKDQENGPDGQNVGGTYKRHQKTKSEDGNRPISNASKAQT